MKTPELTGESATINASLDTVIDLASSSLALSGVTLRTFAEAAADAETDFANGDSVPVFVRVDTTNWKRGTAVYDSATPKLTATWTSTKGTIATSAVVDVFVSRGEELHLDASEIVTGTLDDARVAESNVTQHEAALTLSTAQVTAAGALMDSEVDADLKTFALPASTTISAFGATVVDDVDAAAVRATIGVDVAGTDNSTDVSLAGTPDYITMVGQVLTLAQIDLAADVTGGLPVGNINSGAATDGQVLTADGAGNSAFEAAAGGDLVDDTTPQLGGNLDLNMFQITGTGETVTSSKPLLSLSQTWNGVATAFDLIEGTFTDTASAGDSAAVRISDGTANVFWASKNGELLLNKEGGGVSQYRGVRASPTYANLLEFIVGASGFGSANSYAGVHANYGLIIRQASALNWSSSSSVLSGSDLKLYRDAANTLGQRNSANAQTFNIYNTYTNASNYERLGIKWSANSLRFGVEVAGTGTARELYIDWGGITRISPGQYQTRFFNVPVRIDKSVRIDENLEMHEMTAPAGTADQAKIYAEDNGSGKTRLMVIFGSGVAQQIAIEP